MIRDGRDDNPRIPNKEQLLRIDIWLGKTYTDWIQSGPRSGTKILGRMERPGKEPKIE